MIVLSLLLNTLVLAPVCYGLVTNASWVNEAYGEATSARSILLSVYLAIAVVSLGLLFLRDPKLVASLILIQMIYKVTTPFTVGSITNPVVVSNLLIAAVHSVTLFLIYRENN